MAEAAVAEDKPDTAQGAEGAAAQHEDAAENPLVQELKRVRKHNEKLLSEKKHLEGKVGGFDIEEYRRLKDEDAKRAEEDAKKRGEWDKLKLSLNQAKDEAVAAERKVADELRADLRAFAIEAPAMAALAKHKAIADFHDLLSMKIAQVAEAVKENGKWVTRIKDLKGGEGYEMGKEGDYLDIDAYVGSVLKTKYPHAFVGSQASGSGAVARSAGGGGSQFNNLPPEERLAIAFGGTPTRR